MLKQLIRPYSKFSYFLLGSVLISIFILFLFWQDSFARPDYFLLALFWVFTIFFTQWFGNVYIGLKLDERWPVLEYPVKRNILGVIGLILYSVIAFVLVQSLMYTLFVGGVPEDVGAWLWREIKISIPISFVISFVFSSVGYFLSWKKAVLNAQKLETEMLRYKYESLQNQINPHFLFNSFNVLSDLVEDEPTLAREFIQKMSGLYRYVLESKEQELVPLEEELAFIKSYIFLIKTRFENKLEVSLEVKDVAGFYIVPMALQILVENAIKHNMATSSKILKVKIIKQGDTISVINDLQLKSSLEASTKKGLKNITQQYAFFTTREVVIEASEKAFQVVLPLLLKDRE